MSNKSLGAAARSNYLTRETTSGIIWRMGLFRACIILKTIRSKQAVNGAMILQCPCKTFRRPSQGLLPIQIFI